MNAEEKRLILACSRLDLAQEKIREIRECARAVSNWQDIIRTTMHHGLCPIVYKCLKTACIDLLPEQIKNQFINLYRSNAVKNLSLSSSLLAILNILKANNILAVPFKGPVLAEKTYGDIALRMFGDLDIFIKSTDTIKAKNLLIENGYDIDIKLPSRKENRFLDFENSFTFYHRKNGPEIDLHWELTGRYLLKPIYLAPLEGSLHSTHFMGRTIDTLPDEIMLIYLCAHGTSHCWERLEWLCNFSEMAQQKNIDLSNVATLAKNMGCRRMFYLGLLLSHNLLGAEIPEAVMKKIRMDRGVIQASSKIEHSIFITETNRSSDAEWRFSPIHINLRDTFRDRLKYAIYLYTAPTVKEWLKFPLPFSLTPVYRVIRPLRLGLTYLMGKKDAKRT